VEESRKEFDKAMQSFGKPLNLGKEHKECLQSRGKDSVKEKVYLSPSTKVKNQLQAH
jgi:hypothetical protein